MTGNNRAGACLPIAAIAWPAEIKPGVAEPSEREIV